MRKKYGIFEITGGILQEVNTLYYFDSIEEAEDYLKREYSYNIYTILPVYIID